jgi:MFS family permease
MILAILAPYMACPFLVSNQNHAEVAYLPNSAVYQVRENVTQCAQTTTNFELHRDHKTIDILRLLIFIVVHTFTGKPYPPATPTADFVLKSSDLSLITSILSAGTFFGAIIAGDVADFIGRKFTIIIGCTIFIIGIIIQTASSSVGVLVAGRFISGLGVGFESAIVILYMSEIAPKKVRGALVAGYQFCITIGLLLASCVDYGTKDMTNSGSYRIPIAIQFLWALVLGCGIATLPDSPRYFVKRGKIDKATQSLSSLRGQPADSEFVQAELAEIVANNEYELMVIPQVCIHLLHCSAVTISVSDQIYRAPGFLPGRIASKVRSGTRVPICVVPFWVLLFK